MRTHNLISKNNGSLFLTFAVFICSWRDVWGWFFSMLSIEDPLSSVSVVLPPLKGFTLLHCILFVLLENKQRQRMWRSQDRSWKPVLKVYVASARIPLPRTLYRGPKLTAGRAGRRTYAVRSEKDVRST